MTNNQIRISALTRRANTALNGGRLREAEEDLRAAVALARSESDGELEADALRMLAFRVLIRESRWAESADVLLRLGDLKGVAFYMLNRLEGMAAPGPANSDAARVALMSLDFPSLTEKGQEELDRWKLPATFDFVKRVAAFVQRPLTDFASFSGAEETLDKAFREGDRSWLLFLTQGILFHFKRRWRASARYQAEAARLAPDNDVVLNNFGHALYQMGRYEEAEHVLRRAIRLDPDGRMPLGNLGTVLIELGRYSDAVEALERARIGEGPSSFGESGDLFVARNLASGHTDPQARAKLKEIHRGLCLRVIYDLDHDEGESGLAALKRAWRLKEPDSTDSQLMRKATTFVARLNPARPDGSNPLHFSGRA